MRSISFGPDSDSTEVVSVKILLKQAYSAHVAKVRSLENEVRELREKLLQISESDKAECRQCQEVQKTLEVCKQQHAATLEEHKKKFESLAQKLILLEDKNLSSDINENAFPKKNTVNNTKEHQSESLPKKQVLANINTNITLSSKTAKVDDQDLHSVETNRNVALCSGVPPKSKASIPSVKQKDFFSSLQNSFLDYSTDEPDAVLVTETLDILDEMPKKNPSKNIILEKENSVPKEKSNRALDTDDSKENALEGTKSLSKKRPGKRCASSSDKDVQSVKKCKSNKSKEILTSNNKLHEVKALSAGSSTCAKTKDDNSSSGKDDPISADKSQNLSSFNVNSDFFDVDPSFLKQNSETVINSSKKSKTRSPALEISHDDDADFQTSLNCVSKQGDESGGWKTSKKNPKKSASSHNNKTSSRFKMTLEAPSLSFKKPKYKQTKLPKSIFQPRHTPSTDSVIPKEKEDVIVTEECDTNNVHSSVKEDNSNCGKSQNEMDSLNESFAWEGGGTFSFSEMERLERGVPSTEREKLRNVSIDMDATFVPFHMLQNSNDSVPEASGTLNVTEGMLRQKNGAVVAYGKDESISSDSVADMNKQRELHEQTSNSSANQHTAYHKQYSDKDLSKPGPSEPVQQKYNSFDRVPSPEMPNYKFKEDTVRHKNKRQQLKGFECKECEKYYSALGLSDKEKSKRLKQCSRHRATHVPPATPANFWELDFPDTEECKERGYIGDTQKVALKPRRRRPLK